MTDNWSKILYNKRRSYLCRLICYVKHDIQSIALYSTRVLELR
jgi:hypothetical protein